MSKKNHSSRNTQIKSENLAENVESVNVMISDSEKIEESVNVESDNFTDQINQILKEENLIVQQDKKSDKKNLRSYLKSLISEKKYSQKEILEMSSKEFPHLLKATISTILSDSKNIKYAKFQNEAGKQILVVVVDGIYQFAE